MTDIKLPGGLHKRIDKSAPTAPTSTLCGICSENPPSYTCPKCNVKYCSRVCYQSEGHSSCSETFYRNCCLEGLGEVSADDDKEDREKIAKFLKADLRAKETGKEGDEEEDGVASSDLSDRIGSLDLDDEGDLDQLWDRLTPSEKEDFERQLQSGEAATWVLGGGGGGEEVEEDEEESELSIPWWQSPLVVATSDDQKHVSKHRPPPEIYAKIRPLSSLINSKPSSTIPNNLVNILFAYSYCWRLYNGDHGESAESAAEFLEDFLALCNVVNAEKNDIYPSVAASLCAAVSRLGGGGGIGGGDDRALFCSNDFTAGAIEDVAQLCGKGDEAVARALSDVRAAAKATAKSKKTAAAAVVGDRSSKEAAKAKRYNAVAKKLEFYLGWVVEGGRECLDSLAICARREARAYRKKIESLQIQSRVRESGELD